METKEVKKITAFEFLKSKRFSVELHFGDFYAQDSDFEFFSTLEEAEKFYKDSYFDQSYMNSCNWSKNGDQPTFLIELRELQFVPVDKLEELEEDADEMEIEILDIFHTFSERLKTKSYIFNEESVINYWDSEEEKEEKEQMDKWKLIEYQGSIYHTLPFSKDVISLIDGRVSKLKGGIE